VARFLNERGAEPRSRPPASAIGADGALGAAGHR
jgi:hypothetical protein